MADDWQVLLPRAIDPAGPEILAPFGTCTSLAEYDTREDLLADVGRFDAAIVRTLEVDADLLDRADRLRVVAKHGAGLDNVDGPAATDHGVIVCNTPGANARSVAEHAVLLLLAVRRNLRSADRHVRAGGWDRAAHAGHEVAGDALGLLGFGDIAREVADLVRGFDLSVLAFDPYLPDGAFPEHVERVDDAIDLFDAADAVSVHTPLTEGTHHAVSTRELEALGREGVLVNTSRGGVVDQDSLADALESGTIAGAGLDVFESEPPSPEDPLLERNDVVVTPHVGGVTGAALRRMAERAARNVRTVHEGDVPDSAVNLDAVE